MNMRNLALIYEFAWRILLKIMKNGHEFDFKFSMSLFQNWSFIFPSFPSHSFLFDPIHEYIRMVNGQTKVVLSAILLPL